MCESNTSFNFDKVFRHLLQTSTRLAYHYHRLQTQPDVKFENLALDFDKLMIGFNDRETNTVNLIAGMIENFFRNNSDYITYQKQVYRRQMKCHADVQYFLFLKFKGRVMGTFLKICPEKNLDVYSLLKCVVHCLVFSSIFLMTLRDHVEEENVLFDKMCEILFEMCESYKVSEMLQLENRLGKNVDGKIEIIGRQENYLVNVTFFQIEAASSFNFEKVFKHLLWIVSRLAIRHAASRFRLVKLPANCNTRERSLIISFRRIVARFFREDPCYIRDHEQSYLNYQYNGKSELFEIFDSRVKETFRDMTQFVRLKYTVEPMRKFLLDVHPYETCFINLLLLSGMFFMFMLKKRKCREAKWLGDTIYNICFKCRRDVPNFIRDECLTLNLLNGTAIVREKELSVKLVKGKIFKHLHEL